MKLFDSGKPFLKGNLHAHTTNSDGRRAPGDVMELYHDRGYDFLALTDHWKISTGEETYKDMLLLPGVELDYFLPAQVIHIVGIGVGADLLQKTEKRDGPQKGVDDIRASGGRAILAHPAWSLNTPEVIGALRGLTAAEIFNSVSCAPWNGDRGDSTQILDVAAAHGCFLNTVASDDSHFYTGEECGGYIMLQAEDRTAAGILAALDAGKYYSSRGPRIEQIEVEGNEIHVTCSPVCRVLFHSNMVYCHGRCVEGRNLTEVSYTLNARGEERFVRIILMDEEGRRAWANPILVNQ